LGGESYINRNLIISSIYRRTKKAGTYGINGGMRIEEKKK
jgi:hypothetical protein